MPERLRAACRIPGCPGFSVVRGLCDAHAKAMPAVRQRDDRPSSAARGYDSAWQRLRARFLKAHPRCSVEGCPYAAVDVDHVVALAVGGESVWGNLRGYCHAHHSSKTGRVDHPRR